MTGRALSGHRSPVEVKMDRRCLDDAGILQQAGVAVIDRNPMIAADAHLAGLHVNRGSRRQQGAVGLFLQLAVRALDVALGESIAGGAVNPDGLRCGRHAAGSDLWISAENNGLVGGSIAGTVGPRLCSLPGTLVVGVGDVAGL